MRPPHPSASRTTPSGLAARLAWFVGLWLASVVGLGVVASLIRAMIPR